jgi:hypothetical protein
MSPLTLNDIKKLTAELSKPQFLGPKTETVRLLNGTKVKIDLGNEYASAEFVPAPFPSAEQNVAGYVIGRLSGYDIALDDGCRVPRMTVSQDFARIQHPDLVKKTQAWMDEFFGYEYKVYECAGRLVMHRDTFNEIRRLMTRGPNV